MFPRIRIPLIICLYKDPMIVWGPLESSRGTINHKRWRLSPPPRSPSYPRSLYSTFLVFQRPRLQLDLLSTIAPPPAQHQICSGCLTTFLHVWDSFMFNRKCRLYVQANTLPYYVRHPWNSDCYKCSSCSVGWVPSNQFLLIHSLLAPSHVESLVSYSVPSQPSPITRKLAFYSRGIQDASTVNLQINSHL